MAIIQVWSAPSCQSGAICFGALAPWLSAAGSESAGTPASFRLTVTRDVADRASLSEGRCLRVISQSRGEQWWFVSSVSDSDGDAGIVQVTAGPLRQLLTIRGLVRSGSTFAFTPGKRTVTDLLNTYVLTNLSDDGLSWMSLGTVDFTDTLEIGSLARVTRAAVLDQIESATGHTARLRALTSSGVLTGFALDVVSDLAAGLDTIPLAAGVQQVQRTRDALRAATVAVPFDTGGLPMQQAVWQVTSITGTGPVWVTLRDPLSGNPWPIREDDQVNGLYLEQRDGTQTVIADSRASDSAVQLSSVGTLAVNDLVTMVRDTAGAAVVEVTSPSGIASSRGRLVGTVATKVTDGRRNYVPNSVFTNWTSDTAPTNYTVSAGAVARYPRTSGTADLTLAVDGAVTAGATTLPVRNGTSGVRLYYGEFFVITGNGGWNVNGDVVVFDGSGRASIPVPSALPALADGTVVTVQFASFPARPASFPAETAGDVCRLLRTGTQLDTPGSLLRVPSGTVQVNAAAAISARTAADSLTSTFFPQLQLRNTTSSTTLATATSATQPASSTVHYTLSTSATLSSNTTVGLRLQGGTNRSASFSPAWQGVRWLSLWVGDGGAMGLQDGSGTNTLWHRAQDVLASSATGTRYTVRGVDLTRLLQDTGAPALNQSVRLRSELLGVDATVKIVKLDYDFAATESLNLELGAITPRLTGVTVSL